MKHILIVLCALTFMVSCNRDKGAKSPESDKQAESSNQSGEQAESPSASAGAVEPGMTVGLPVSNEEVVTDFYGQPCTSSGSSTFVCGDPNLKTISQTVPAQIKRPRKYSCSHSQEQYKGMVVTYRRYEYMAPSTFSNQPDVVLACEVVGSSSTLNITAYIVDRGVCDRLVSFYVSECREMFQ